MKSDRTPRRSALGDRLVEAGWLSAVVLSPLFFDLHSARTFEPDKAALVRTIATWMVVACAIGAVERGGFRLPGAALGPLVGPVLVFALATAVSCALSLSTWTSWWGSYERLQGGYTTLAYLVLFGAVAIHLRFRDQVERLVNAIVLASVPVCAYGIVQRLGLDPIKWSDAVTGRVYSTLGAATFLGAYVAMVLPFTLAAAWRPSPWRVGYCTAAGLQLVTLVLTKSRGAYLGLFAALFIAGLFALLEWRNFGGRRGWAWKAWLGGAALALSCVALLNLRDTPLDPLLDPIRKTAYGGRLASITENKRGTGKIRLLVWEAGLRRMRDLTPVGAHASEAAQIDGLAAWRPLVGFGPESMRLAFTSVQQAELAHFEDRGKSADRAHNASVDHLVTGGLLGLGAYWFLTIGVVCAAASAVGITRTRSMAGWLLGGSLLGAFLALGLGRSLTYVPLGAPCGLLAALIAYGLRHAPGTASAESPYRPLAFGALGVFLADFVETQFGFGVTATHVLFWVVLGLLVALARGIQDPPAAEPARLRGFPAALVLLVTLVLFVQGFGFSLRAAPSISAGSAAPWAAGRVALWHAALPVCALLFAWRGPRVRLLANKSARWLVPLAAGAAALVWFGNVQPIRADVFLARGNLCARAGRLTDAIALHERGRACDPRESRYSLVLAEDHHRLAAEGGDPTAWQRGEAFAIEAREREPFDADHAANLARFYLAWGLAGDTAHASNRENIERAMKCFEDALALSPQDVLIHKELAQAHRAAGDFAGAVARLEASAAVDPRYPPTWVLLGDTQAVLGDVDAALAAHREAMYAQVRGIDGFATFADEDVDLRLAYYAGADRLGDVLAILDHLRETRPKDARVPWTIARAFVVTDQFDEALVQVMRAVELGRVALRAARELAARYPVAAFLRDAEELARRILFTEVEIRYALALALEREGDDPRAIGHLERVLELVPDDPRALGNLAVAHRRSGDLERAMLLGRRALAASPPGQAASWQRFLDETRASRGR